MPDGKILFQVTLMCSACGRVVARVHDVSDNDPEDKITRAMAEHLVIAHPGF